MEKERYDWIDYAKFISIFLVISFHTPPHVTGYIGELIRQLRMPAFFLISGFLFN
ncbi:MAG: acyltransferase family protein, partial [Bacteroidaceae bacterium]